MPPNWDRPVGAGETVNITYDSHSFSAGRLHIGGTGGLFSAIAGVRSGAPPLYKPRGWPASLSTSIADLAFQPVVGAPPNGIVPHVLPKTAEVYVRSGHSVYGMHQNGRTSLKFVSIFGAKLPGWLHLNEIYAAIKHQGISTESLSINFKAALSAMKTICDNAGEDRVRLTFWFEGSI